MNGLDEESSQNEPQWAKHEQCQHHETRAGESAYFLQQQAQSSLALTLNYILPSRLQPSKACQVDSNSSMFRFTHAKARGPGSAQGASHAHAVAGTPIIAVANPGLHTLRCRQCDRCRQDDKHRGAEGRRPPHHLQTEKTLSSLGSAVALATPSSSSLFPAVVTSTAMSACAHAQWRAEGTNAAGRYGTPGTGTAGTLTLQ